MLKVIMIKFMMMKVTKVKKKQGLLEGGSVLIAPQPISSPSGAPQRRQGEAGSLVRRVNLCAFVCVCSKAPTVGGA
jgi:hypothetical protein